MKQAVAVVVKKEDRFLLIKRAKKGEAEDYWCPITGAVEQGETQEQAVIREAKEEMDMTVKPLRKVWECPTEDREYLLHWWHVEQFDGNLIPNPEEVKDYKWVSCSEMTNIKMMFAADRYFFSNIGISLPDSIH